MIQPANVHPMRMPQGLRELYTEGEAVDAKIVKDYPAKRLYTFRITHAATECDSKTEGV
jgi:hypothetical protein